MEHLDRDKAAEVSLPTSVDNPGAARAEALQHLVASVQLPPDERIGGIERICDHEPRLYIVERCVAEHQRGARGPFERAQLGVLLWSYRACRWAASPAETINPSKRGSHLRDLGPRRGVLAGGGAAGTASAGTFLASASRASSA